MNIELEHKKNLLNNAKFDCLKVILYFMLILILFTINWTLVIVPLFGFPIIYYFVSGENMYFEPFKRMFQYRKELRSWREKNE